MLVGDSGVGKTCLLVRFKDGAFLAGSFISTVGIDFRVSVNQWCEKRKERNHFGTIHTSHRGRFEKTSFHQDLKDACHIHSQIFTFTQWRSHRSVRFRSPLHLLSGIRTWNLVLAVWQQLVSVLTRLKPFVYLSIQMEHQ